jgi:predicted TPR repeat methyltransferase
VQAHEQTAAIAALQAHLHTYFIHVYFCCKHHHLQAHEQTAAIAALRELAAAAAQRQEAVAARLARLGSVADTLAERSSLLAGLHWSLPRPASAAEQQMDKQLEVRVLEDFSYHFCMFCACGEVYL